MRRVACFLVVWVGLISLAAAAPPETGVVSASELELALDARQDREAAARDALRSLLARAEVRQLAAGAGIDLRRAEAAVATLEGEELHELETLAAAAQGDLAGGDVTIQISLVAALLIVIIIILLAK